VRNERPCVMVVDADPDSLAQQFGFLRGRGFRVATYSSPVPACAFAANERPAAIVTSFGFPECDGPTAVRRLKEASPQSHLLVRMTSEDSPSFGEAVQAGAEILPGSAEPELVLRRLEEAVGERPLSAQP